MREGNAAARAGQLEEARKAFAAAVEADPSSARARTLLGNALFQLGKVDEARAAWGAALERDAASADAVAGLARLDSESGDAGAALTRLGTLGASDGPTVRLERARALLLRGLDADAAQALVETEAVLAKEPASPEGQYLRGCALVVLKRYADAQGAFEALQRAAPRSPLGPYGLARLAAAQSRVTDTLLYLAAARTAAGPAWKAERVAADPAFAFVSGAPEFQSLVGK